MSRILCCVVKLGVVVELLLAAKRQVDGQQLTCLRHAEAVGLRSLGRCIVGVLPHAAGLAADFHLPRKSGAVVRLEYAAIISGQAIRAPHNPQGLPPCFCRHALRHAGERVQKAHPVLEERLQAARALRGLA